MYIRSDTMKSKYVVVNSNFMGPDFPHFQLVFSMRPILFLFYEESLVSSNMNSKLFLFHSAHPKLCMLSTDREWNVKGKKLHDDFI